MQKPKPYRVKDGTQYVKVQTVISDTLDLDYIAYLAVIHADFDPTDQRVTSLRMCVVDSLRWRGLGGSECWMDELDNIDEDAYAAAKALAARAYGFDFPAEAASHDH